MVSRVRSRSSQTRRKIARHHAARCGAIAAVLMGASLAPAVAETPEPPPKHTLAVPDAAPPATAPFGALTLLALGGTLLAGLVTGAGLASLRMRRSDPAPASSAVARDTVSQAELQATTEPTTPAPKSSHPTLPPVVLTVGTGRDAMLEDWIASLERGARFGPKLLGVTTTPDCNGDEAIARIAAAARETDRDVVIVDACGGADQVARALDRHLQRRSKRADPFGAGPRVEIVPLRELMRGRALEAGRLRDAFAALALRADVILIDLPAIEDWPAARGLLKILDEIVVFRNKEAATDIVSVFSAHARAAGAEITGQILVA